MFQIGSVFIPVTDLEKSKQWYVDHLDVQEIDAWKGGVGFFFSEGSVQLGLIEVTESQTTEFKIDKKDRNAYFNFVVCDIEAAHQRLAESGVKTTEIRNFGDMRGFDFFDPDQNVFSVVDEEKDSPFHKENVRKQQVKRKGT